MCAGSDSTPSQRPPVPYPISAFPAQHSPLSGINEFAYLLVDRPSPHLEHSSKASLDKFTFLTPILRTVFSLRSPRRAKPRTPYVCIYFQTESLVIRLIPYRKVLLSFKVFQIYHYWSQKVLHVLDMWKSEDNSVRSLPPLHRVWESNSPPGSHSKCFTCWPSHLPLRLLFLKTH